MNTISPISNGKTRLNFFQSLRGKLILLLLAVSLVPLITMGMLTYNQVKTVLEKEVLDQLAAIRDLKSDQIEDYFNERQEDIRSLSNSFSTSAAIRSFAKAMLTKELSKDNADILKHYRSLYLHKPKLLNANDGSAYSTVHAKYHPLFKEYLEAHGYYDIFLIEPHNGNILYTVMKEKDFGTNLINGLYANTSFGAIFKEAIKASNRNFVLLKDFAYYAPSNRPSSFVASPIFDQSELVGVLVYQLSIDKINTLMQHSAGLGETGETLLISATDFLMRSNSRFFKEITILKSKVDNEASRAAARGESGVKTIVDAYNNSMVVAYKPLIIAGVQWLLYAKINEAEAFKMTYDMLLLMLSVMGLIALIITVIAIFMGNLIVKPILAMIDTTSQLAAGNLNQSIEFNSKDEIGVMGQAFQETLSILRQVIEDIVHISQGLANGNLNISPQAEYQGDFSQIKTALATGLEKLRLVNRDIIQVSQGLAAGDLHVMPQAEYSGDFVQIKTALETSLSDLDKVIKDIVQVSQGLAKGISITTKTEYRGDFIQIKKALENAATQLAEITAKNKVQDWLKTGQTQLNAQITGEQEIASVTKKIISFLTTYVEAQVGLFYLMEETEGQQYLQLIASYAYVNNDKSPTKHFLTKGLVGQAALERKVISVTQTPKECPPITRSGLAGTLPRHVLLLPFLYEDKVKGVIEIGSVNMMTEIQREFLEQVMPNIGIAINMTESRAQMQTLLKQSQQQAEVLKEKQAELEANNAKLQIQSTELENQQEELRQTNDSLEERTKDLEFQKTEIQEKNIALEQTKRKMEDAQVAIETKAKELELASRYKSEFLANMSHELRTPLNSLLILAQLLANNKSGNLDENQIKYAKTIHSAGNDLLTLINEILDLSKVEAGKVEVQFEEVSLANLLQTIEQKFCHVAEDKGLSFQCYIADNLPPALQTDEQRLQQIINNLLSNAFKFTSKGIVKVVIQHPMTMPAFLSLGEKQLELDKIIAISVVDSGAGIPKDKQQLIFEAFQQADGSTSRRYGGTGLGLSISRQLARLLGGELTLESKEEKGSTFTLYLPETAPNQSLLNQESGPISNGEKASQSDKESKSDSAPRMLHDKEVIFKGKKVLIVDDDARNTFALTTILEEYDMEVVTAGDGKEVLNKLKENKDTAIILMDIMMPEMDGYQAMREIRKQAQYSDLPIIALTAKAMKGDKSKCIEAGANDYLAKPLDADKLVSLMRIWLYR
ncbi:response regulator [Candidatus Parabeggiatoa sp. HSG14]|uniref:response regulator n=1 Tax=Candidatus Parabeggiatoa sp. HSG14 TaxID=3055593 RepID=UPI0025A736DD|nr:ATP-binding protein [Thiotrichales bacterium HSG14]